jgi:hypothetical protein
MNQLDACNTKAYKNEINKNSVSLILFFDAAHYSYSQNGKVWTVLAMILNLPPIIRGSFFNIIPLFFWQGYLYENFNGIFENNLPELVDILDNFIELNLNGAFVQIKIFIHLLIGDSPARCKITNSTQFNGEQGCFHCLQVGKKIGKAKTYPYRKKAKIRSESRYLKACENILSIKNDKHLKKSLKLMRVSKVPAGLKNTAKT